MEIIESLDAYIASQKTVAIQFLILGVCFLVIAGVLWQLDSGAKLLQGLKAGCLVWSLLILAGGGAYYNFCNQLHAQQIQAYEADPTQFLAAEHQRVAKVVTDFPIYQMAFAACIVASLVVILFVSKAFFSGIAFATLLLFSVLMLIEAYSKTSIDAHFAQLEAATS
ncbi:MAG TPA: hypothetical protein DCF62_00540 [Porticoccaceae bacterium]|nr:hypothetical protein [Porticoccaceae bacterium]